MRLKLCQILSVFQSCPKQTGNFFEFKYKNKLSFKYVPELKDFM